MTHPSPGAKVTPKPPQYPKPVDCKDNEAVKGLSETTIPKEIIDNVISEVSLAKDRQGNKALVP